MSTFVLVPQYLHNQFAQVCMNSLFLLDSNLKLLHSYSDKEGKTADIIKLLRRLEYGKCNLNFKTESFFFFTDAMSFLLNIFPIEKSHFIFKCKTSS